MQNGASFSPEQMAQMYQQQMSQFQGNGQLPQFQMMTPYPYGFNPYIMNGMNGMNGMSGMNGMNGGSGMNGLGALNGFNSSGSVQGLNHIGTQAQSVQSYSQQRPDSSKSRSKSLPRKRRFWNCFAFTDFYSRT